MLSVLLPSVVTSVSTVYRRRENSKFTDAGTTGARISPCMYLLCFTYSPHSSYPKALKTHSPTPLQLLLLRPPPRICFRMKDRPPSSYGPLYVPPHHRRKGSANASATTNSSPSNTAASRGADNQSSLSKPKVDSYGNSNAVNSYPYLPPHHSLGQLQQQKEFWRHDEVT